MTLEAGTAYVDLQPQLGGGFFSKIKGAMGGGGLKKVGLAAGAVLATGLGAGLAVGIGAFKLGESFDEAFDTIRVGTGATGDALADLEDDFKEVFSSVPTTMDLASTAVADLNTRTGQTGEGLVDLAKQMLEMSRITGSDLAGNNETTTRLFGDWGVATDEQAGKLDKLFRASQASGVGISDLASSAVQFGAPLRNLGFTMDESIALFAKWNKEGVNTEAIFGGMKIAVGKFAFHCMADQRFGGFFFVGGPCLAKYLPFLAVFYHINTQDIPLGRRPLESHVCNGPVFIKDFQFSR